MSYEFDDDDLEDGDSAACGPEWTVRPAPKRGNRWVILGALFELVSDFSKSFAKFFDVCMDASLSKYKYEKQRQEFIQQASLEIEKLTSGEYNATTIQASRRIGSRPDESQD